MAGKDIVLRQGRGRQGAEQSRATEENKTKTKRSETPLVEEGRGKRRGRGKEREREIYCIRGPGPTALFSVGWGGACHILGIGEHARPRKEMSHMPPSPT